MPEEKDDLNLSDLDSYHGTEQYHKIQFFKTLLTDGIVYIMGNGYSWFVTDTLAVIEYKPELKGIGFFRIELKLDKEKKTARMEITDGNDKMLYTQYYTYTNAQKEIVLYLYDNVLLLSGEY